MKIRMAAVAALAMSLVCGAQAGDPSHGGVQKQTLLETTKSWDGAPYSYPTGQAQMSVLRITIPAHTKMQWHEHPVPNAAYVLSGSLTVEKKDGTTKMLHAGEVLAELVNEVHRGVAGDSDVVLIVFYAGASGLPLSK